MNPSTFNWISHLIRNNPTKTSSPKISRIGQQVIADYQCGQVNGNRLYFSPQDKSKLRQHIISEFGVDPFTSNKLPKSRTEIAKIHHNEKLSNTPISHDHILVNSPNGSIQLNQQNILLTNQHVPSAGLLCLASGIQHINHNAIVVVENLEIMQICHQLALPDECQNALWLYRGDNKTGARVNACYQLLKQFGQSKLIIAFTDMDPKGLEIALTLPYAKYWLGAQQSTWIDCLSSQYGNTEGYDKQANSMKYLLNQQNLSIPFQALIKLLHDKRSSIRQEHLYAHQISLDSIKLHAS